MAKPISRHPDPIDPKTGKRRWPEWHDDTLHALDRLNRILQGRYMILVIGLIVVGYFTFRASVDQGNTAHKTESAVIAIQHSRYQSFYDSCRETNSRHDETVNRLSQLPRSPGINRSLQHRQIKETILLINAIVPKVPDCKAFAEHRSHLP